MTGAEDRELMEASLEALADVAGDLTPPVFERFLAHRPEWRPLFADELGQGRMLFEVLEACLQAAQGHEAARVWIDSIAADHTRFSGIDSGLYRDFLEDMLATMQQLLGDGWTPEVASAWRRQTSRILSWVEAALEPPSVPPST